MVKFVIRVEKVFIDAESKIHAKGEFLKYLKNHSGKIDVDFYICKECGCDKGMHYISCSKAMVL